MNSPSLNKHLKILKDLLNSAHKPNVIAIWTNGQQSKEFIFNYLQSNLPNLKIIKLSVKNLPNNTSITSEIQNLAKNFDIIFITDLEHSAQKLNTNPNNNIIKQLNFNREKIFSSNATIILTVDKHYISQIKQAAPDFWDWIFYQFDLSQLSFKKSKKLFSFFNSIFAKNKNKISHLQNIINNLPPDHKPSLDTLNIYCQLINLYINSGKTSKAAQLLPKALKYASSVKDFKSIAQLYEKLSLIISEHGNIKKAIELQKKAIAIKSKFLPKFHPDLAKSYSHLGYLYTLAGNLDMAELYMRKALIIQQKNSPSSSKELAQATFDLAQLLYKKGQLKQALHLANNALKLFSSLYTNTPHNSIALSHYLLAKIYFYLKNCHKALEHLNSAIQIFSSHNQPITTLEILKRKISQTCSKN